MINVYEHFSEIAEKYRGLRTTDLEPIFYIRDKLKELPRIEAADIGCGAGRYDLKLFEFLGEKLFLYCIDSNKKMLQQLYKSLVQRQIDTFKIRQNFAKDLPFQDQSLDCVFTFNAIHHFSIFEFFNESSRVVKEGGYLFIYTRSRSQNSRNIWGQYFPLFNQKETRLYEIGELESIVEEIPELEIQNIEFFKYQRVCCLEDLVHQAQNHHYSTFYLYVNGEFEKCLEKFEQNLIQNFEDFDNISWTDENVLYVIRKQT